MTNVRINLHPVNDNMDILMDTADPQRTEIITALAKIMISHGRYTEADACNWLLPIAEETR